MLSYWERPLICFQKRENCGAWVSEVDLGLSGAAIIHRTAEELSQSPWTIELAQEWLAQGQWQMLELPSVLSAIREQYDGMLMRELGAKNIAVFCADQITVVDIQTLPEPKRPSMRC